MNRGLSLFVRDNLEAFAVAIALALIVRHYSLEAFRIPSKSMMPTLIGSDTGGDRILVDKFRWVFGEPHRWEPTVFQYPCNRSRNFIKRLIGLPGERIRIHDGDIWTSRDGGETWTIARKTKYPNALEALFFPYYPSPVEAPGHFDNRENWDCGPGWTANEKSQTYTVDTEAPSTLRFREQVTAYQSEGVWGDYLIEEGENRGGEGAGDLRVRFQLRVERAGTLNVMLTEHGLAHRLVLGADGSRAIIALGDGKEDSVPLDLHLRPGEYSVSFANVDNTLVISIGGDATLEKTIDFPAGFDGDATGTILHRVLFEAQGLKAQLSDIRIARDVHYTQPGEYPSEEGASIPPDNYLMLGDNTSSSKDSRLWFVAAVTLKDGTVIRWEEGHEARDVPGQPDADFDPAGPDQVIEIKADVDGLLRRFHTRDVAQLEKRVWWGLVPRENLVGRAFAIFWPIHLWPIVKTPTRIGLIR
jgi:signal peptidase I